MLAHYGPDAAEARALLRRAIEGAIARIWPENKHQKAQLAPNNANAEALYDALQNLAPQNDTQRVLKSQVLAMAADVGQMRWLLFEQADSSISPPLLVMVVFWLAILFFSFGLFGPSNSTAVASLVVAALSVSGAIFLILELDQPFTGVVRISSQPMLSALSQLGR
jgi:membrane-bound ClpP family serine protease